MGKRKLFFQRTSVRKVSSKVPCAKIYETLDKLVDKGLAYRSPGTPVRYQALPLKNLLESKKDEFDSNIEFLLEQKDLINKQESAELLWYMSGHDRLLDKAIELISSATEEILISLWPEEAEILKAHLEKAAEKGVKIISIQFDGSYTDIGNVYKHFMTDQIYKRHGSEMFLLIDYSKGMFMFLEEPSGWKGFHTGSAGICRIIENYLKHDIYINRILQEHSDYIFKNYGPGIEKLLDI